MEEHSCFRKKKKIEYMVTPAQKLKIQEILKKSCVNSALAQHAMRKHNPVADSVNNDKLLQSILNNQKNDLMRITEIDKETQQRYSVWEKERQHRFTGSTCYGLYTHCKSQNQDWNEKRIKRKTFLETGLIVSKCNSWLAISSNGVIFKDDVLVDDLEIKWLWKSASMTITEAVKFEFGKCLEIVNGMLAMNITFDEKFVRLMLTLLKPLYLFVFIPKICCVEVDKEDHG
ncbi:hypothetical protein PV328_007786 [Microctonus aethiopoides]|uniref:Uncharacterized protein n=1 Tax=Microctonus aethiopoides TaxID=144406 RepID=A0AA39CAC9_9HYME|nr:hypothetical protein PV328_007786 [Microctonus aethiopoides]